MSVPIRRFFDFAETCVFSKQSPGPFLCGLLVLPSRKARYNTTEAPLLPKLRGQFAEFLKEGSHVRLRILSSPTCVGLRYGHLKDSLEAFLGSMDSASWISRRTSSPPCSELASSRICLGAPPTWRPHISNRVYAYPPASPHRPNAFQVVQEC